ncbi:MAG: hypothetical protein ACLTE2_01065 [Eubacteriales bacterium]
MAAKAEARHIAKMELVEASIVEIPVSNEKLFDKSESEQNRNQIKEK